jgi:hypothetical protein
MPGATDPVNLGPLVEELYARRKWLDRVIASLESAIESPDYRLIAALTEASERGEKGGPAIDLSQIQKTRIQKLAADVTLRKNGLEPGHISTARPQIGGAPSTPASANGQHKGDAVPGSREKNDFKQDSTQQRENHVEAEQ